MTGELTYTASEMAPHAPAISIVIIRKVKYPLRFVVSCVQPITQQYKIQELFEKHLCNQHSHYEK